LKEANAQLVFRVSQVMRLATDNPFGGLVFRDCRRRKNQLHADISIPAEGAFDGRRLSFVEIFPRIVANALVVPVT
jgi:hypothetical protein